MIATIRTNTSVSESEQTTFVLTAALHVKGLLATSMVTIDASTLRRLTDLTPENKVNLRD
jgi:hypothetical protein